MCALDDLDVAHRACLALQHLVGTQGVGKLQHGDVLDDTGQVNRCLNAGVAPANHGYALALEQRAVTVRAVRHALATVFLLTGYVHFSPACAGRQDDRTAAQGRATFQANFDVVTGFQAGGLLLGNHVNLVLLHVLLQAGNQLGAFGVGHGDEVLDADGIHHLATEAFGNDTGADAFTRSVDGCRGAGRATADDQYVVGRLVVQLGGFALAGAAVDLVDDFGEGHAALTEGLAVQVHRRHGHDLALVDFILEQGAVNHHVGDVGVQHRHQVQRLDHVRTVLAGQRNIGFKVKLAVQIADLLQQGRVGLGRVAAGLQQRQYQRGELVAHRDAGEANAWGLAGRANGHARGALVFVGYEADLAGHLGDFDRELVQFFALGAVIGGHADFNRVNDILQVRVQLFLQVGVQHVRVL